MNYDQALAQSDEIQNLLWAQAVALKEKTSSPIFDGYFIQSLNEMIALQNRRVIVGLDYRIPDAVWIVLYLIIAFAVASVGYHSGLSETSRSLVVPAFVLIFTVVIVLIADLDRPAKGALRVSQNMYIDLQMRMNAH